MKTKFLIFLIFKFLLISNINAKDFWVKLNFPVDTIYSIVINNDENIYTTTGYNGIFRSTDKGNKWYKININPVDKNIWKMAISPRGDIFASVWKEGIYRSIDNGISWVKVSKDLVTNNVTAMSINNNGDVFFGIYRRQIYRSTDNGENWIDITSSTELDSCIVFAFLFDIDDHSFIGIFPDYKRYTIYRSNDNGDSWIALSNAPKQYVSILKNNSNGDIIALSIREGIYQSKDNGENWEKKENGLDTNYFHALIINKSDHIYTSSSGKGVFRSIDNGETWVKIDHGQEHLIFRSMTISQDGYIYAGTYGNGLYRSKEPMELFYLKNEVIPKKETTVTLDYNQSLKYTVLVKDLTTDHRLSGMVINVIDSIMENTTDIITNDMGIANYTITVPEGKENGIYEIKFFTSKFGYEKADTITRNIEVKHISDVEEIYFRNSISINPNPFSDFTIIKYDLLKPELIRLSIHDILGREIEVLKNELQEAGEHNVICNSVLFTTGLYFVLLNANSYFVSLPITILK